MGAHRASSRASCPPLQCESRKSLGGRDEVEVVGQDRLDSPRFGDRWQLQWNGRMRFRARPDQPRSVERDSQELPRWRQLHGREGRSGVLRTFDAHQGSVRPVRRRLLAVHEQHQLGLQDQVADPGEQARRPRRLRARDGHRSAGSREHHRRPGRPDQAPRPERRPRRLRVRDREAVRHPPRVQRADR